MVDWPLRPYTTYCKLNDNSTVVWVTDGNGLPSVYSNPAAFAGTGAVWSGYTTGWASGSSHCDDWTNNGIIIVAPTYGYAGNPASTVNFVSSSATDCNSLLGLLCVEISPSSTPSATVTPSLSFTSSASASVTRTPSSTNTATASLTPTLSTTNTATASVTQTPSVTPSASASVTPSLSTTSSATATETPSTTNTATASVTPTVTPTPSVTRTVTPSATSSVTPSLSTTNTATASISTTNTPTASVTPTLSTTSTTTATPSPTLSTTNTATASLSPGASPSATSSQTPSRSESSSVTPTASVTPSVTPSSSPVSASASVTPSRSVTPSVSETPTCTPTSSTTVSRTTSPSPSRTASRTPSPSPSSSSSPSLSSTASQSPSPTPSASLSGSTSSSLSSSVSPTRSLSSSASATVSLSMSASSTISISQSPSTSPSTSASVTPSKSTVVCAPGCATCVDTTTCTTCSSANASPAGGPNAGLCVCNPGHYASGLACNACHASCDPSFSCGADETTCSVCNEPSYVHSSDGSRCILLPCPAGEDVDISGGPGGHRCAVFAVSMRCVDFPCYVTEDALVNATMLLTLTRPPVATVYIDVISTLPAKAFIVPSSLHITPGQWATGVNVTIVGLRNFIADGVVPVPILVRNTSSADARYVRASTSTTASVLSFDADASNVAFQVGVVGSTHLTEGSGASINLFVAMNYAPLGPLPASVTSGNPTRGAVTTGSSLVYTPANWRVPQTVVVTDAGRNWIDEGDLNLDILFSSPGVTGAAFRLIYVDVDTAGVTFSPLSFVVSQLGTSQAISVVLDSKPLVSVMATLSTESVEDVSLGAGGGVAQLTFSPATWNVPQIIVVTGLRRDEAPGDMPVAIRVRTDASASRRRSEASAVDDMSDQGVGGADEEGFGARDRDQASVGGPRSVAEMTDGEVSNEALPYDPRVSGKQAPGSFSEGKPQSAASGRFSAHRNFSASKAGTSRFLRVKSAAVSLRAGPAAQYGAADWSTISGVNTYIAWPRVDSLDKYLSPLLGGWNVTALGKRLLSGINFTFNGVPAYDVRVDPSGGRVVFTTPFYPNTGYVNLRVRNADGGHADVEGFYFTNDCPYEGSWGRGLDCIQCPEGAICPGGYRMWAQPGWWTPDETAGFVRQCPDPSERCLGGRFGGCAVGYGGPVCGSCVPGYFSKGNVCEQCGSPNVLYTLLIIDTVFFALIAAAMVILKDQRIRLVVLAISTLQGIRAVGQMASARLPSELRDMYYYLSLVSFDVSFLRTQCISNGTGYSVVFWANLVLVFLLVTPTYATLGFLAALRKARRTFYIDRVWRATTVFASAVYLVVSTRIFQAIYCVQLGANNYVLWVDPDSRCFFENKLAVNVMAMVLVIVIVVGYPVAMVVFLYRLKRKGILRDDRILARYGYLYNQFRDERFYMAFSPYAQLMLLALASAVGEQVRGIQFAISLCAFVLLGVAIVVLRPFKEMPNYVAALLSCAAGGGAVILNFVASSDFKLSRADLYVIAGCFLAGFVIVAILLFVWLWRKHPEGLARKIPCKRCKPTHHLRAKEAVVVDQDDAIELVDGPAFLENTASEIPPLVLSPRTQTTDCEEPTGTSAKVVPPGPPKLGVRPKSEMAIRPDVPAPRDPMVTKAARTQQWLTQKADDMLRQVDLLLLPAPAPAHGKLARGAERAMRRISSPESMVPAATAAVRELAARRTSHDNSASPTKMFSEAAIPGAISEDTAPSAPNSARSRSARRAPEADPKPLLPLPMPKGVKGGRWSPDGSPGPSPMALSHSQSVAGLRARVSPVDVTPDASPTGVAGGRAFPDDSPSPTKMSHYASVVGLERPPAGRRSHLSRSTSIFDGSARSSEPPTPVEGSGVDRPPRRRTLLARSSSIINSAPTTPVEVKENPARGLAAKALKDRALGRLRGSGHSVSVSALDGQPGGDRTAMPVLLERSGTIGDLRGSALVRTMDDADGRDEGRSLRPSPSSPDLQAARSAWTDAEPKLQKPPKPLPRTRLGRSSSRIVPSVDA